MATPEPSSPAPRPGGIRQMPGPRGLDALRWFRSFQQRPLDTLLRARATYGDLSVIDVGVYPPVVLVSDHAVLRQVLVENASNYKKSRAYDSLGLLVGKGLIASEGELWRRQRALIQPAFHPSLFAAQVDRMAEATARALDALADKGEVDLHAELVRLTLTIVGEVLFGFDVATGADEVAAAFTTAARFVDARNDSILAAPLWAPTPANLRFRAARATLDQMVQRIIDERRQSPNNRGDLLGMLMAARDEVSGQGLDDRQLRDEVMTMLIAGHETSANGVTWLFHAVMGAPEVEQRLAEEARRVLGERPARLDDLSRFPYTLQVIQEALRLYPPIWMFERTPIAPDTLLGHRIEPGAVVSISPYLLHRVPSDWPDPERFDPERFRPDAMAGRRKMAWLPFGAGGRRCIGERVAIMEMQVITAMAIARYRFVPVPGHAVDPEANVTLRPRDGLRVRVERRAPQPTAPTPPSLHVPRP